MLFLDNIYDTYYVRVICDIPPVWILLLVGVYITEERVLKTKFNHAIINMRSTEISKTRRFRTRKPNRFVHF